MMKLPKSKSSKSAIPSTSVARNPPASEPTTPSTIVRMIPTRWRPGFSSRAKMPTNRPQTAHVTMPTEATYSEEGTLAGYTITHVNDVPDVSGDYPGEIRMATEHIGAEQVAFTYRRMVPGTGGKGSYGHRHRTQEETV